MGCRAIFVAPVSAALVERAAAVQLQRSRVLRIGVAASRGVRLAAGCSRHRCLALRAVSAQKPDAGRNVVSGRIVSTDLSQQDAGLQLPDWLKIASKGVAALGLAVMLAVTSVGAAEAARSGGRVGGSRFSSYSSSSSSGYSRSYSSPSGGAISSYSTMRVAPSVGYGVGVPSFFFPMGGYGYGMGYPVGGGSIFTLIFYVMIAAVLYQVVTGLLNGGDEGMSVGGERVAVGRLQVALLGSARQLQRDLDRIAARADTSSAEGLHYVLQETVLALQRNPDYWVYGSSDLHLSAALMTRRRASTSSAWRSAPSSARRRWPTWAVQLAAATSAGPRTGTVSLLS